MKFRNAIINFITSVRPSAWNNSAPSGRNFRKFDIWVFFEFLSRKFNFHENLTRVTGTVYENQFTLLIKSRSVLLRIGNASDKSCREKSKHTFCVHKHLNIFSENHAVYEKMWKNIAQRVRPTMTKWRMRIACIDAYGYIYTHTRSECDERTSMLHT